MKRLQSLLALAVVVALSVGCNKEVKTASEALETTFCINLPSELSTRADAQHTAFNTGTKATELHYAVYEYDNAAKTLGNIIYAEQTAPLVDKAAQVTLRLARNAYYKVFFFAISPNATAYSLDFNATPNFSVDYANVQPNDEDYDAFWESVVVQGGINRDVDVALHRPFAQVNVGSSDLSDPTVASLFPNGVTTKLEYSNGICSSLNLETLVATEASSSIEFDNIAPVAATAAEKFPAAGYSYMAMNYILVAPGKSTVDVALTLKGGSAGDISHNISNAPVASNCQTNIFGTLLTDESNFNVTVDPDLGPITTEEQLNWAIANGGIYTIDGTALTTLDLTNANPATPLDITINSSITEIKLGTLDPDATSITAAGSNVAVANPGAIAIRVPKDVAYPSFSFPAADMTLSAERHSLHNFTLVGDPESSLSCSGLTWPAEVKGLRIMDNITIEGVKFTGSVNFSNAVCAIKSNITIENCQFDLSATPSASAAISIKGTTKVPTSSQITVKDCTIEYAEGVTGDKNGIDVMNCTGSSVSVENCTIKNALYHGIQIRGDKAVAIRNCRVTKAKESAIKVMPNPTVESISITDCPLLIGLGDEVVRVCPSSAASGSLENATITIKGNTIGNSTSNGTGIVIGRSDMTSAQNALLQISGNTPYGGSNAERTLKLLFVRPQTGSDFKTPFGNDQYQHVIDENNNDLTL